MELLPLDYAILAVAGFLLIVGMFKGLSGWLGTIAGTAVAAVVATMGFGCCRTAAAACSFVTPPLMTPAAAVLDFILALIVFGIVRRIVARCVTFLVPQPLNALLGMAGGLLIAAVLGAVLAGTAIFEGCAPAEGLVASNSEIVRLVAEALSTAFEGVQR